MPLVAFSITKRTAYRDSVQEWSNVYVYRRISFPNAAEAEARIDEIVGIERDLHSTQVTFVRGRCWSTGGTKEQNQMIFQKALTGTGNQVTSVSMDRERAFLVMWPAGLDVRGRPVRLKKWFHSCGNCASQSPTDDALRQTTGLTTAQRNAVATSANRLKVIGVGEYQLAAESGRDVSGDAFCHKYLEHHQLGDQWRSQ